jgi:hypothetical protein
MRYQHRVAGRDDNDVFESNHSRQTLVRADEHVGGVDRHRATAQAVAGRVLWA